MAVVLVAWMASVGAALSQPATPAAPVVKIQGGSIQGARDGDVVFFKGVPFAAPPVGALRWQAPQPVKAWSGIRQAAAFAPDCAATPEGNGWIAPRGAQSEDCLYLNIWKPAHAEGPLPVMVWIYGGGYTNGGTTPIIYDGANLARQGVILVSINYRVGQLGFFAHPALAREQAGQPRGNYGFLDQIAALKWVHQNIGAFGGDANNVTAFGESAGGFSVHMLLISPLAKGLIDKAIIESGGGRRTIRNGQHMNGDTKRPSAEKVGLAWAKSHGIEGEGPQALAKLRAMPTAEVLRGLDFIGPLYAGPMIDGMIMPYNMMTAYDSGRFAHIPLMIGTNTGDMNLNRVATKDALFARFGEEAALARATYDPTGQADTKVVIAQEGADEMMHETARFTATRFARAHLPTYLYRFGYLPMIDRPGAAPPGDDDLRDTVTYGAVDGAFHTTEIPFVFDTVAPRYGTAATGKDLAVGKIMSGYWVTFAKTGNPNGPGRPAWTPFAPASDDLLLIGDDTGMKPDPWKARLDASETLNLKTRE